MNLQQRLILKGEWFLPENEQEKLSGRLIYDPIEGIRLEVHGIFGHKKNPSYVREHQIIIGWVEGEKYVTLLSSYLKTPDTFSTYVVNYFFYDIKVSAIDLLCFTQINIHFNNLEEWVGISGFEMGDTKDLYKETENKEAKILYKLPQPIECQVESCNLSVIIDFTCKTPTWKIVTTEQSIKQITTIQLKSEKKIFFEDLLTYSVHMSDLFAFGTYQYPVISSVEFVIDGYVVPYFAIQSFRPQQKKDLIPQQMLFIYDDIREYINSILDQWFLLCNKLGGIVWLITEQFTEMGESYVNSFLNLAQAAESIHSKLYNHPKNDPITFRNFINELISYIPNEHREFVRNKINRNDLVLADRVDELMEKCGADLYSKFIPNKDSFVKEVKDTRNYYTHYDGENKTAIASGIDLYYLSKQLQKMLICVLLLEVGIKKDVLLRNIERIGK